MTDLSQPGIFNALDYGMRPDYTGTANALALQGAIHAAQTSLTNPNPNPNGAIVLIPSFYDDGEGTTIYGDYAMEAAGSGEAAITIPVVGDEASTLLIMGTGPGTTLAMQTPGSTLFSVNSPFTSFQDLTVIDVAEDETSAGKAFDFSGGHGYTLFRVNIVDFPNGVSVESGVLASNLLQCSISYDGSYSGAACTAIKNSGAETNVEQCTLTFGASGSQTYTGVNIVASSYARVTDTQISGFGTGILLGGAGENNLARGCSFTGLDVDAVGVCVNIGGPTYDVSFVSCSFTPTSTSLPTAAVVLGTSGGENGDYDTIRFTACTAEGFASYGLEIKCGQNLQVNGGSYSGNGTAGIAILGNAEEIQITGANCIGTTSNATQEYGIYMTSGIDVQVVGANCSGNSVAGIGINGTALTSVQNVRIVSAVCENSVLGGVSQQYGVYIVGASGVVIDGCSLTGNMAYAVYLDVIENVTISACDVYSSATGAKGIFVTNTVGGSTTYVFIRGCNGALYSSYNDFLIVGDGVSHLEVTDCAGYNDLGTTILANGTTAPSGLFNGTSYPYSYYGPTAFYLVATGMPTVQIDGQTTYLTSGGFTLAPGETAEISGGSVVHFLMVGK
jgi:hypothetical protein